MKGERRRRYILHYNPKEAKRQLNHRTELVVKLEDILSHHREKFCTAQWAIELLTSPSEIGCLDEKFGIPLENWLSG